MMWSKPTQPINTNSPPAAEPLSPTSIKKKNPGRRYAQIIKLKPDCADKYKELHAAIWPEVLKQIKGSNIQDYSIFYDADSHTLFATFKYVGYDYAGDMQRMRENPKVREWWALTDSLQESLVPGATQSDVEPPAPSWWKPMEEVFYTP